MNGQAEHLSHLEGDYMNEDRYRKLLDARGNTLTEVFARAIDFLQSEGFQTELWISKGAVMLRWVRNSKNDVSRWHVESCNQRISFHEVLDNLGRNALGWLNATKDGSATESSYAVKEG